MIVCYRMMFLVLGIITGILGIYFIKSDDISYLNDKNGKNSSKKKGRRLSKVFGYGFSAIGIVSAIGLVFTFLLGEARIENIMNQYFLLIIIAILIMSMFIQRGKDPS